MIKKTEKWQLIKSGMMLLISFLIMAILLHTGFSWFSNNKQSTALGSEININSPDILEIQLNSYPVTEISGNTFTYTTDIVTSELPIYDPSDIIFSEYKKALALEFIIYAAEDISLSLNVVSDNPPITLEPYNFMSNCLTLSEAGKDNSDNILNAGTDKSFVTIGNGDLPVKTVSLDFGNVVLNKGINRYYMVLTYNEPFMKYITEKSSLSSTVITYKNDITFNFESVDS